MTPLSAAINTIFNRPRDAAAILFLIEDSSYVIPLWQHLRGSYLPSLLAAIEGANPSRSAEALWMSTSENTPFCPPFDTTFRRTPRWDDIPAINFSPHGSGGTISPASATRAIGALSATFGHGPATRHLVIVAAMNPPPGPRGTWSTAVELLRQEEIRVHLIVRSQSAMGGPTPLYLELIGKGHVYQSFTDDGQFAFYLSDFYEKGKGLAVDDRVPNSGSRSTTVSSNRSSTPPFDKPSLVYRLQKMNGLVKKRRSRARRDQPTPSKPGQPYLKSYPHPRTIPSTAQSTSPDPSDCPPSRRKDSPRLSRVKAPSSHFDPLPPGPSADEHRQGSPSTASTLRRSSPSSSYCPSTGTSLSPGPNDVTPLRASLPIPTPTSGHFQHMTLTTQFTPDSLSPSLPGYHEFQGYDHELPGDLRLQYRVSQTVPVDRPYLEITHFNDNFGTNHPCWNEYDGQQGRFESPVHLHLLGSYPPASSSSAPRLVHWPEQMTTTSSLPPMSHGLSTPPAENPGGGGGGGGYFYSGHEDCATSTSSRDIYLLTDHSSDTDLSTTAPYYF